MSPQKARARHGMTTLWAWVLSLIVTEFFKGAYRVFDLAHIKQNAWAATWTLSACALFMSKQVADIVLYFRNIEQYDPQFRQKNTTAKLLRYASENAIEACLLFFIYGSIKSDMRVETAADFD